MNRQNRRHPTHPLLPIQYSSKKRILDLENLNLKASTSAKGYPTRRRGKWKVI